MHEDETMALRALQSCIPVAGVVIIALCTLHHRPWALCYATGASLSLFSLCSLTVFVPMLLRPGAPGSVKAILCLTLFMKLPVYMRSLYMMTRLAASGAAASVVGIALAPMVITFRAVVGMARRHEVEPAARKTHLVRTGGANRQAPAEGG
jgi:hypothetical protein